MKTVIVDWQPREQRFEARGSHTEHRIHVNAPHENGGPTGFSASDLLLAGAGACSAWDVVGILRKQRQRVTGITVTVEGQQADAPPNVFERVRLVFTISGHGLNASKVRKAVELSERKYCAVVNTIRGVADVSCDVVVLEAESPTSGLVPTGTDAVPAASA